MRPRLLRRATLWAALRLLDACAAPSGDDVTAGTDAGLSSDATLHAAEVNGGTTGAMLRQTTPAGLVAITSTITLPDYDPTEPGAPWVYYGIGDESAVDMEAGMAFQRGDPTKDLPHRWLPYLRQGKSFLFGDEPTRVLPGATIELTMRLDGGTVGLLRDGQPVFVGRDASRVTALPIALAPAKAHIRRVVGQAVSSRYDGEPLGRLGPVVFRNTSVTGADGQTEAFAKVAGWRQVLRGVVFGSVAFPAESIAHAYDPVADQDTITLFP